MLVVPMLGDLQPRRHPDALVLADIVEEADQPRRAAGAAGETTMQADRHHLRRALAFGIEHVESILQIGEELLAFGKALRIDEAHVVGVKRIGNDELLAAGALDPIGQIIGIGIAEIEEAALLQQQTVGVDRGASGVPAEGARAGRRGVDADRFRDLRALLRLGHVLVLDPLQAVAGDVPARLLHGSHDFRIALQRRGDTEHGGRALPLTEQPPQPPQPRAREPYSNIDSILAWRWPGQGCAPSTSDRNASEAGSPCRMLFLLPSSKLTTTCTATRALPGHCGCGGLRP